jgi:hypothetical protein
MESHPVNHRMRFPARLTPRDSLTMSRIARPWGSDSQSFSTRGTALFSKWFVAMASRECDE